MSNAAHSRLTSQSVEPLDTKCWLVSVASTENMFFLHTHTQNTIKEKKEKNKKEKKERKALVNAMPLDESYEILVVVW